MPTYEYKCKSCGKMSEFFQSMTAKPMRKCPACGRNALERQIGIGAAIVFKGSGFYQTDYRSESYKKAAEAEKKPTTTPTSESGSSAPSAGSTSAAQVAEPKNESAPAPNASSAGAKSGESARKSVKRSKRE
ncbi:MAG: zinc ribbon domain-containing protein [Phycisphaeraceae bacterium]|nr:zinc ribbon domain-containing protein [Phycisphaeraceae bacterium]